MATVDIVIPTYRGLHPEAGAALHAMIREAQCFCGGHAPWECPRGKHSIRLLPHTRGSSVVHWSRNQIIAMALYGQELSRDGRPDAEYLFLMDDDMVCRPNYLSRLLSFKKDFVTGISTIRRDPPRPNIRLWKADEEFFITPVEWDWNSNKLMEIDAVGAAFMLIRRRVFEKMGEAWLECHFERAEDHRKYPSCADVDAYWNAKSESRTARFKEAIGEDGNWKDADCWWFQFLSNITESQRGELGEDISFCWKAKKLGFKIFADPQVTPGHIGDYGYSIADYRDWLQAGKDLGEIQKSMTENVAQLGGEGENSDVDGNAIS